MKAVCKGEVDAVPETAPDVLDDALKLLSNESSTLPLDVPLEDDEDEVPSNAPMPPP